MDDQRLENLITNLELAEHNLSKLTRIIDPMSDPESLLAQTITLLRHNLVELRNYEVQKEIEGFSNLDGVPEADGKE
ncbi:MAG: hypothetical protein JXA20_09600 [Spirochaetes bacterium]|nr:hypothetical protein [Spirochaetota bacterium]